MQTQDLVCARQEGGCRSAILFAYGILDLFAHAAPKSWFPTIAQNGMSFTACHVWLGELPRKIPEIRRGAAMDAQLQQ